MSCRRSCFCVKPNKSRKCVQNSVDFDMIFENVQSKNKYRYCLKKMLNRNFGLSILVRFPKKADRNVVGTLYPKVGNHVQVKMNYLPKVNCRQKIKAGSVNS